MALAGAACAAAATLTAGGTAHAADSSETAPGVVATIRPVHSLVTGVMEGVGAPHLLVSGGQSPHAYSLRPSDAAALEGADLVVWIGPDLETFLADPLRTLADDAHVVTLAQAPGLTRLPVRAGGAFEPHDHGHDHDHDHNHGHEQGHGHEAATDMHLWLDPDNAAAMVDAIAAALAEVDPDHAETYRANAAAVRADLSALTAEVGSRLAPVDDIPFIVFHDAYRYFENRFDLAAVGAITVTPGAPPGAARLAEIRATLERTGAVCVFAEPQFEPRVVQVITEGTGARAGTLDPVGADLSPGPDLYPTMIRRLAGSLHDCLAGP
jgi:zinc transport system substrate-binding protein